MLTSTPVISGQHVNTPDTRLLTHRWSGEMVCDGSLNSATRSPLIPSTDSLHAPQHQRHSIHAASLPALTARAGKGQRSLPVNGFLRRRFVCGASVGGLETMYCVGGVVKERRSVEVLREKERRT
ncbi:hypothetical protein E2C01_009793 [Portunus trituberculatus]|uniref:Uncharacterized protein n=1 Tax=Portunus trituberculatus TaxID=210409 RepID=A0A5B7D6N9_PORTR|nr:hypothetical protein [Portunus trituberculatus]